LEITCHVHRFAERVVDFVVRPFFWIEHRFLCDPVNGSHTEAMARTVPTTPSPKLQALLRDFQQIASMAGFLNSSFDLPQLRLFFTLYIRVAIADEAEGLELLPKLQAWCDKLCTNMREGSGSSILPPQISYSPPQPLPNGASWSLVATVSFNTKVTENSYMRVRTSVFAAYKAATVVRDMGPAALIAMEGIDSPAVPAEPDLPVLDDSGNS
jgi:hypothetical protein